MELFGLAFIGLSAMSWWIIGAAVVSLLVFIAFVNDDKPGTETLIFLAIIGGIGYLVWGQLTIGAALLSILYYLLIGAVWSIGNYSRIIRNKMKLDKENNNVSTLRYYQQFIDKNRIVRWIAYWPFSILNFIVGDFIFEIFNKIAEFLKNTYKRITNYFYRKMFGDLDPETGRPERIKPFSGTSGDL